MFMSSCSRRTLPSWKRFPPAGPRSSSGLRRRRVHRGARQLESLPPARRSQRLRSAGVRAAEDFFPHPTTPTQIHRSMMTGCSYCGHSTPSPTTGCRRGVTSEGSRPRTTTRIVPNSPGRADEGTFDLIDLLKTHVLRRVWRTIKRRHCLKDQKVIGVPRRTCHVDPPLEHHLNRYCADHGGLSICEYIGLITGVIVNIAAANLVPLSLHL